MLLELKNDGLTDAAITQGVAKFGASVSQPTINRLRHGVHRDATYTIGRAIERFYRERKEHAA